MDEEALLQHLLTHYQLSRVHGSFVTVRTHEDTSPYERLLVLRLTAGDPIEDAPPWDRLCAFGNACIDALNIRRVVYDISSNPVAHAPH